MLKIKNLHKVYSKNNLGKIVNEDINLSIKNGEIVCIMGQNGAGKTTLIKQICGLVKPTEGTIEYEGYSLINNKTLSKDIVGAVLEGSRNIYYYMSIMENIKYFGGLNKLSNREIEAKANRYLELFELTNVKDKAVGELSRGMQQKVAIIVTLLKSPQILLLDEPTLGLDINSSKKIVNIISDISKKENKIVMITTHDVRLIEALNERLIFIKNGRIIADESLIGLKAKFAQNLYEVTFEKPMFQDFQNIGELINEEESQITFLIRNSIEFNTFQNYGSVKYIKPHVISFEEIYDKLFQEVIEEELKNDIVG